MDEDLTPLEWLWRELKQRLDQEEYEEIRRLYDEHNRAYQKKKRDEQRKRMREYPPSRS